MPATKEEVLQRIQDIADDHGVSKDCELESKIDDFGFDSLDKLEFLMDLEREFYISIFDETAENWKTIGDMVDDVWSVICIPQINLPQKKEDEP